MKAMTHIDKGSLRFRSPNEVWQFWVAYGVRTGEGLEKLAMKVFKIEKVGMW